MRALSGMLWEFHDPLAALIADHPGLAGQDGLLALSQAAALVNWPAIEAATVPVSIVLRRAGARDAAEWRDHLEILAQMIAVSPRDIRLLALSEEAAATTGEVMQRPVAVLPALARLYDGERRLTLSRSEGMLSLAWDGASPRPARSYNLARLRRMAVIGAEEHDPDLADLAAFANGAVMSSRGLDRPRPVVVIVVPNGVGMGHVTRMLAVARHLRDTCGARVLFWSFSRSVGIISQFGFEAVLRQTARHLGADPADWLAWEAEEFAAALENLGADLVVQDSHALDDFVVEALARPGTGAARLALVRRGMWQSNHLAADALESEDLADLVVEPGDLAAAADRGVTRGRGERAGTFAAFSTSAPVTLTAPGEMLDTRRARRALGLGRGRHCLVSLGSGMFGDWSLFMRHLTEAADRARVKLVWARSPLAAPDPALEADPTVTTRRIYPLARCLAAFDGVVSAAGYNSFHELMQLFDRPVLLVPRRHSTLDDQAARAEFAATRGWAATFSEDRSERDVVTAFMADVRAGKRIVSRPQWRDGALEIATTLTNLIEAGRERT